tara:strand:- start:41 stop:3556 length:3516 start_codon:yes stop_codon:yes gene_type:complete
METTKLKKFAQTARTTLIEQVATKLNFVLGEESLARRENPIAVKKLEDLIRQQSEQEVIERIAYIWFNRFCALRFMDMNRYNRRLVVSAATGDTQPEVLALAKSGDLDDKVVPEESRKQILNLLNGKAPSRNPEAEVYRLLLVAYCNQWHESMPFLFQRIDDYTELLMPDDLLSSSSVLADMRDAMPEEACEDVEVIGWLYQFYISDKKDDVFAGLKKNKKVTPENIPAATQLFTPHWIVRYLVENSLGRLWILNHPESKLADHMEYYIKPAEDNDDTDYLKVASPKDLKICDPACGSGHMLTYAFDLLYSIYEEQGYDAVEIPTLILTHNLYGIEIDERAGELAAFALTMKARARHRRFFSTGIRPNICVLEPISFDDDELDEYMNFIGRDLFTTDLEKTLRQFDEVDNFGSLIRPALTDVTEVLERLHAADVSGQLFLGQTHQNVLRLLKQADYLSPQYHVVVANPPYMGSGGMNKELKDFIKVQYPEEKSDLMTCFMERCKSLSVKSSMIGMINLPSWLFLNSFEKFRSKLLIDITIVSLVHLGRGVFGSDFGSVAFVLKNSNSKGKIGVYRRLFKKQSEVASIEEIRARFLDISYGFFTVNQNEFLKLPGNPIGYWVSPAIRKLFSEKESISNIAVSRIGMATGRNELYLRTWSELSHKRIGFKIKSREESKISQCKWFPHAKGGEFRKWYGNSEYVVNWENDGQALQSTLHPSGKRVWAHNFNLNQIFKPTICWTTVTIADTSFRYHPFGYIFDAAAGLCQPKSSEDMWLLLGALNSTVSINAIKLLNPTVNLAPGYLDKIPIDKNVANLSTTIAKTCINVEKADWDAYETSWDFKTLPLVDKQYRKPALKDTYKQLRAHWQQMTDDMQRLEEENNRIFIDAYGLQDELAPEVPLKEITLTCNPYYRYGGDKTDDELEALLLADTMRELISYAVGCMFGRYSLDKPGLILANQGDTIKQYLEQIPEPSFTPDKNNVIPILDDGWFSDDIVERFRKFIKVAFGEAQYESNMQFIELALGKNDKPRDIRDYFLKDFYNDHVKRYKKRPIYWLFSSGSFNALIYMHRYQPDTVSVVLNDYLREFRTKLNAYKDQLNAIKISGSQSQSEKTKAQKKLDITAKMITEMEEYERDVLYPLATQQVEIDLDDGVKVNYPKFGKALKKVTGLSS